MARKRQFKNNDRVRGVYHYHEPNNIGTVKIIEGDYCIVYDDEPETEYAVLDDQWLELLT